MSWKFEERKQGKDRNIALEEHFSTQMNNSSSGEAGRNGPDYARDVERRLVDLDACVFEMDRAGIEMCINGYSNIGPDEQVRYLDEEPVREFWHRVAALDVPVYLHPREPLPSQRRVLQGYPELVGSYDVVGGLGSRDMLENARLPKGAQLRDMERVVVGVDPSGFDGETGDEQGIVVAGKEKGKDGLYVVLDDCSVKMRPEGWGRRVIEAYRTHKADRIVAEANYGGAMVRSVIQSVMPDVPVTMVTATRGKALRAEPICSLYEQGRVKHVRPFPELEDQLCMLTSQGWQGAGSPDRADALVWALTELSTGNRFQFIGAW